MTPEEILKIAREAGFQTGTINYQDGSEKNFIRPLEKENIMGDLLKFAAAMVLIEREECAKICDEAAKSLFEFVDDAVYDAGKNTCENLAKRIRNREAMKS